MESIGGIKIHHVFKIILLILFFANITMNASAYVTHSPCSYNSVNPLNEQNNRIIIHKDQNVNLTWLEGQINNASMLSHSGKTWFLNSSLTLDDATMFINSSECDTLYISNMINGTHYGTMGLVGKFYVADVTIKSWNYTSSSVPDCLSTDFVHTDQQDLIIDGGSLNNSTLEGLHRVTLNSVSDTRIQHLRMNNSYGGFILVACSNIIADDLIMDNFYKAGGVARAFQVTGGHDIHVSNLSGNISAGGVVFQAADNCTMENIYVNEAGWMGIEVDGGGNNCSIKNVIVKNAFHNGMDIHGASNLYVENVSVYDSESNNCILTCSGSPVKKSWNITINGFYTHNSTNFGDGITISSLGSSYPDAENITITNFTSDGDHQALETAGVNNLTVINMTCKNNNNGFFGNQRTNNTTFIDSSLSGSANGIALYNLININLINTYFTSPVIYNPTCSYTTNYYPNLLVYDSLSNGIQNAQITANTTVKNGYGKNQTSFYTDNSGKLYDSGNRSNWMALPEKRVDYSGTITYNSSITASKSGHSNSTVIAPSSKWYSPNPASLQGTKIVLSIDVDSGGSPPVAQSSIVEFFPEATKFTKNTGESVTFSVKSIQPLTANWLINGKLVQNNTTTMVKSWNTSGTYNVTFSGSASGKSVLNSWSVYVIDPSNYHPLWDVKEDGIVDILDVTSITRHYGEIYTNKPYPRWDVNQDGVINIQDLYLAGDHFGETVN